MDNKQAVQQQFGQVAANYRTSSVHQAGVDLDALLRLANISGGERVLDAGTGTGHTALALAAQGADVLAIDLTEAMLDQGRAVAAERQLYNIRFERADVELLPYPDAAFDLVVTRYSAHHWPHPGVALAEFARVLRPAGRLLLADTAAFDEPLSDTFLNSIELLRDTSHVRDHTVGQWLGMLQAAGFSASLSFRWNVRLEFDSWIARMQTPEPLMVAIRQLLAVAPHEVRAALAVEPDGSFTIPGALIEAHRP